MKYTRLLVLVLVVAFLLRVYPYIHYPYLLTNDAMRDFAQVRFLQENQAVSWEHAYGRNPTLHLVVYLVSLVGGADAWYVGLFVPQLVSALGILFFYLFLRNYVDEKYALLSCFFLATFGPNIWWGAQAVRETIGLFFFPFVLYAFDRFAGGGIKGLFVLAVSFFTMLITHNLSTLLVVGMVGVLALVKHRSSRTLGATATMGALMIINWKLRFPWYYEWLVEEIILVLVFIPIGCLVLYYIEKRCRDFDGIDSRVSNAAFVTVYVVVFFIAIGYLRRLLVFAYPPQQYLSVFLLGLFFAFGISKMNRSHVSLLMMNIPLLVLLSIGLYYGTDPDFDASRVAEYLVYPNAVFAAMGLGAVSNRSVRSLLVVVIILGGLMIYPPVFVLGTQISQDSRFYDVRSHIRYIPDEGIELMKWGQENGYVLLSVNPNFNSLREVLYPVDGKKAFLVSEYDFRVLDSLGRVRIRSLGVGSPEGVIEASKGAEEIYQNKWGTVYGWNENLTDEAVIGEYVSRLRVR